jgi:hypothetical protein
VRRLAAARRRDADEGDQRERAQRSRYAQQSAVFHLPTSFP